MWKLLRIFCINFGWDFTYTSVTGQQNTNTDIKCKVIVSQVSVVMSQVAHRKCWKRVLHSRRQITASVSTCSPGEPSTRFGPQCDCHAHRQRTKLAGHFRCNGGKKLRLHMQTDWKMKCHCMQWTYVSFMLLSTIAKNILSTKPEFEIQIWDIHSVTARH